MSPIVPHFAAECYENLKNDNKDLSWPSVDEKNLEEENVNIVIQINGKKRSIINVGVNLDENKIISIVKDDLVTQKYLQSKKIKKSIYIKNKLINLII